MVPPQLPANGQRGSLLAWVNRWPPCLELWLVAPDRVEGVCGVAGAAVQLAEVVGDFVGNRLGNGEAVNARREAWGGP